MRFLTAVALLLQLQACKHPLAIVGEGDIVDRNGSVYGCTLEQFNADDIACTGYDFTEDYIVNYEGMPKPGWRFDHWEGPCKPESSPRYCWLEAPLSFSVAMDQLFPSVLMPRTTAVFVVNAPPVADAGPDQSVNEETTVTLDASKSADPDGDIVSYLWEQTGGIGIELSDLHIANPTFDAVVGSGTESLTFLLTVFDSDGGSGTDIVVISVSVMPETLVWGQGRWQDVYRN